MVYKLSWADFDGTKKLLIGSGGDLVRTNVDGDPTECCCPEECSPDDFSDDFSSDNPLWFTIPSEGDYEVTGGQLEVGESVVRRICRGFPSEDGTITVQITCPSGPSFLSVSNVIEPTTNPDRIAELVGTAFGYNSTWNRGAAGLDSDFGGAAAAANDVLKIEMDVASGEIVAYRFFVNGASVASDGATAFTPSDETIFYGLGGGDTTYDDFSYTFTPAP